MNRARSTSRSTAAALCAVVALSLAGCAGIEAAPSPSPTPPATAVEPSKLIGLSVAKATAALTGSGLQVGAACATPRDIVTLTSLDFENVAENGTVDLYCS